MIVSDGFDDASSVRKLPLTHPESSRQAQSGNLSTAAYEASTAPQSSSSPLLSDPPSGPPPAYPGHQAIPQPSYSSIPPTQTYSELSQPFRSSVRALALRRFLKAFVVAIVIYALAAALVSSWVDIATGHRWSLRASADKARWEVPDMARYDRLRCAAPGDWDIVGEGGHGAFQGQSSALLKSPFTIPIRSNLDIFFHANNSASGSLQIIEDATLTDHAEIFVRVDYYEGRGWDALQESDICLLALGSMAQGIRLSPSASSVRLLDQLHFVLVMAVPAQDRASPAFLPEFTVNMPQFNIDVGFLAKSYTFDTLLLQTRNGEIKIGSISARDMLIRTTNGAVRGSLIVSHSLAVDASNSRIDMDVKLLSGERGPSDFLVRTSDSPLRAKISLESSSTSRTGGAFRVVAQTKDAPLDVAYVSMPLGSVLDMEARTSNAPAMVQLHPAYEGGVELKTTYLGDIDIQKVAAIDPSGQGRKRRVSWGRTGRTAKGNLAWGSSRAETGTVSLTSDAEIHLRI